MLQARREYTNDAIESRGLAVERTSGRGACRALVSLLLGNLDRISRRAPGSAKSCSLRARDELPAADRIPIVLDTCRSCRARR